MPKYPKASSEYPKSSHGKTFGLYFSKGTIKPVRWNIVKAEENENSFAIELGEAASGGHSLIPSNGKCLRLQFLSSDLPRGWPKWGVSPAHVNGNKIVIPKKTLVVHKPRATRNSKKKATANGSGNVTLKDMFSVIDAVNVIKKELGSNCVLSVDPATGMLKALIER